MRSIYNFLFIILFCLSAPFYFAKMRRRGGWRSQFGERFANYGSKLKQALTNRHTLWLHAVSVGEVNLATHLIRQLEPRLPNLRIVVSTTTSTGMAELRKQLPTHINKIYYPIDRRKFVQKAFQVIRPKAVILVEAEIWPNFLWQAQRRSCPVFLVNARLSDRSFNGYRFFGFLFRRFFTYFSGISCPSEGDAIRLKRLGAAENAIHVVGNLKFDAASLGERPVINILDILRLAGKGPASKVIIAGSTHPGEEALMARIFLNLKKRFPELYLIIAPRHAERGRDVGKELEKIGLPFVYRTEVTSSNAAESGSVDCLLLNTTGELRYFYQHADAIFIGKSMLAEGGQNPLEPGSYGKPIVFGPNMQNFKAIAEALVSADAALQVHTEQELENTLAMLLSDPQRCQELGAKANDVVRKNLGALERTVHMILQALQEKGIVPERT